MSGCYPDETKQFEFVVSTADLAKLKNLDKRRTMLKKMVISLEIAKKDGPIRQMEDKDDDFFEGLGLNSDNDPEDWENGDSKDKKQSLPGDPY